MRVFISWSGDLSRDVAAALGEWLPQILPAVDPFVSTRDLSAGSRWAIEISERLEETDYGIVCVTRNNQFEPWLNYEAGALAKSVAASQVVPLAIDLAPAEIDQPLGQFQGTEATASGIREIVESLNKVCPDSRPERYIDKALEKFWPDLETEIEEFRQKSYPGDQAKTFSLREEREMLEEVLQIVRGLAQHPPYLTNPEPRIHDRLAEDIREIMRSSGVRSWSTTYMPDTTNIGVDEQVNQATLDKLALLGKLRNQNIQISQPDSNDPPG